MSEISKWLRFVISRYFDREDRGWSEPISLNRLATVPLPRLGFVGLWCFFHRWRFLSSMVDGNLGSGQGAFDFATRSLLIPSPNPFELLTHRISKTSQATLEGDSTQRIVKKGRERVRRIAKSARARFARESSVLGKLVLPSPLREKVPRGGGRGPLRFDATTRWSWWFPPRWARATGLPIAVMNPPRMALIRPSATFSRGEKA